MELHRNGRAETAQQNFGADLCGNLLASPERAVGGAVHADYILEVEDDACRAHRAFGADRCRNTSDVEKEQVALQPIDDGCFAMLAQDCIGPWRSRKTASAQRP